MQHKASSAPTILVTGRNGQVGFELRRSLATLGNVVALDRAACDLANPDAVREVVRRVRPDVIVNPAAYTAVDKAETESDLAFAINGTAVAVTPAAGREVGALRRPFTRQRAHILGRNAGLLLLPFRRLRDAVLVADDSHAAHPAGFNVERIGNTARSLALGRYAYEQARQLCTQYGFNLLVAEADYNIAWLYYLRGDYLSAMEFYSRSRIHCREAGDAYHLALCDLDEAEMYLELNLTAEGGELARRAASAFAALGLPYEQAKALVSQALACGRARRPGEAAKLFAQARRLFAAGGNAVWLALIDLHEAVFARRRGNLTAALRLCRRAWKELATCYLPAKAALCEIIEAQVAQAEAGVLAAEAGASLAADVAGRNEKLRADHEGSFKAEESRKRPREGAGEAYAPGSGFDFWNEFEPKPA